LRLLHDISARLTGHMPFSPAWLGPYAGSFQTSEIPTSRHDIAVPNTDQTALRGEDAPNCLKSLKQNNGLWLPAIWIEIANAVNGIEALRAAHF
jgi:hypothetical protein